MEDGPNKKVKPTNKNTNEETVKKILQAPCQSDVSSVVKPMDIFNQILSVTIVSEELIGVSKGMSSMLQDVIKPKVQ